MIHSKDENELHINQNIKPNNVRKKRWSWYITLIIRRSDTSTKYDLKAVDGFDYRGGYQTYFFLFQIFQTKKD